VVFFDKIENTMTANVFKLFFNRMGCDIFCTDILQVGMLH